MGIPNPSSFNLFLENSSKDLAICGAHLFCTYHSRDSYGDESKPLLQRLWSFGGDENYYGCSSAPNYYEIYRYLDYLEIYDIYRCIINRHFWCLPGYFDPPGFLTHLFKSHLHWPEECAFSNAELRSVLLQFEDGWGGNWLIPSGKRLHNYGKIHPFFMGKSTN